MCIFCSYNLTIISYNCCFDVIIVVIVGYCCIDDVQAICKQYYDRLYLCESQKWDLEYEVRKRDYEVLFFQQPNKPFF